ncbi:MAG: hypothetical protein CME55_08595 [Halieaceae bacterium]|nr:hypothetical protein [Halieaceae bacterium]|tara:strand:+ start:10162 stop:11736 length:1575 start_codon:yes stop_codon:yes gene_type:complete
MFDSKTKRRKFELLCSTNVFCLSILFHRLVGQSNKGFTHNQCRLKRMLHNATTADELDFRVRSLDNSPATPPKSSVSCMNGINDATGDATWWGMSAKPSDKVWVVYYLLTERAMIASRIAEELGLNRSTVSRHIKKLDKEQYIKRSHSFESHNKRIEATSNKSVTGYSKAYVKGPRSAEADIQVRRVANQEGVRAEPTLPGGAKPMIDIHRVDLNLPALDNGLPTSVHMQMDSWKRVEHPEKLIRGWAHVKGEPVETSVGPWNVYFRRKGEYLEDGSIKWGEFCLPNPVRITLPERWWISPDECLDEDSVYQKLNAGIFEVSTAIQKKYGFKLGLPKQKTSQLFEAGALRYDPELAKQVKDYRTSSGKGMMPIADGITADGSHDLLKDGFVHLDCETPLQAAMQTHPTKVLDHLLKEGMESMEQMRKVAEETVVTIEEQAVKSSDSIQNNFENHMATMVERMMNSFNEQFENHLQRFFDRQNQRAERIMREFQDRLQGVDPALPETQTDLFRFAPENEWPDDDM